MVTLYYVKRPMYVVQTVAATQAVWTPSQIVNMDQLRESISMLTTHSAQCSGKCTLEGETMHLGLAVIMQASCVKCGQVFSIRLHAQKPVMENSGQSTWVQFSRWQLEAGWHAWTPCLQRWKSLAWTSGCILTRKNSLGKKCSSTLSFQCSRWPRKRSSM